MDPVPENRLSIETTIQKFNKFLYNGKMENIHIFKQITHSFITNRKQIIRKSKNDYTKEKNASKKMKILFKKKNNI